jgi:hypothetical protein
VCRAQACRARQGAPEAAAAEAAAEAGATADGVSPSPPAKLRRTAGAAPRGALQAAKAAAAEPKRGSLGAGTASLRGRGGGRGRGRGRSSARGQRAAEVLRDSEAGVEDDEVWAPDLSACP